MGPGPAAPMGALPRRSRPIEPDEVGQGRPGGPLQTPAHRAPVSPVPVLKKVKHRLVENMSSGTADALGLSRAILCNGESLPARPRPPARSLRHANRASPTKAIVGPPLAWPWLLRVGTVVTISRIPRGLSSSHKASTGVS